MATDSTLYLAIVEAPQPHVSGGTIQLFGDPVAPYTLRIDVVKVVDHMSRAGFIEHTDIGDDLFDVNFIDLDDPDLVEVSGATYPADTALSSLPARASAAFGWLADDFAPVSLKTGRVCRTPRAATTALDDNDPAAPIVIALKKKD